MKNLYGYKLEDLEELMISLGQKKYRATQIFKWIYERGVTNFDEMSDISLSFREVLKNEFTLSIPTIYKKQVSSDGTIKLLLSLGDDSKIETVLMRYNYGLVACVTSQVGCNMGCAFCASGLFKKQRNLEVHELVGQILVLNNLLKEENKKITHVVVMGTGEPFDNYDNVMDFINIINDAYALAIGIRHITVSTSGIVPKIKEFAKEGLGVNLAISLHAPNNEIRNKIMKINKAYDINELIESVKEYLKLTNRRVTFEYIMLKDINDTDECAKELSNLLKGINCYVNIIPYNETNNIGFKRSLSSQITRFCGILKENNINVTIRREFGSKVSAACGQLRSKIEEENK